MKETQTIQRLQKADKQMLTNLYLEHRISFLEFAHKFSMNNDDILDVYQDAIIVLQEKAIAGKLNNLTCSLKTYLFSIGKYMLFDKNRKNNKTISSSVLQNEDYNYKEIVAEFNADSPTEKLLILQYNFDKLGKKCKEVYSL